MTRRRRERNQTGWLETTAAGEYQANWNEYVLNPATGKTQRKHRSRLLGEVKKMTLAKAEKELAAIVAPLNQLRGAAPDARITFEDFYRDFYLPTKGAKWGAATKKGYARYARLYVLPAIGGSPLEELDYRLLQVVANDLAERGFAESLVRKVRTLIGMVLREARKAKYIAANPVEDVEMPSCAAPRKPTLSRAELKALWQNIPALRDQLVVIIGTCCALTASELFGLVWECVHPDHLLIRSSAYEGKLYEYRVKRKARMRSVPIPPVIYKAFMKWKAAQQEAWSKAMVANSDGGDKKVPPPPQPGALVFPGRVSPGKPGGTLWSGIFLQRHVQPVAEKLGITVPVTFQVMRRSFVTWNRAFLKDVQEIVGHSDIRTTANVYAQEVPDSAAAVVAGYHRDIMKSEPLSKRLQ